MKLISLGLVCTLAGVAGAHPDTSLIRREIRAHLKEVRGCYDRALKKDPKLEGRVVATFTINKSGSVIESRASGLPPVDACIARVMTTLKFPANAKGNMVINYPFAFAPAN